MISLFLAGDVRGAPYHGLCKDGLLYGHDGTTPVPPTGDQIACPLLSGRFLRPMHPGAVDVIVENLRCTVTATVRAPGVPAITRTPVQAAQDEAHGHAWLDHFPMPRFESGTWMHGGLETDSERRRQWLLAHGPGDVWRMRISSAGYTLATDTWLLDITGTRYGRHDGGTAETVTRAVTVQGLGQTAPPMTVESFESLTAAMTFQAYDTLSIDETDDGRRALIGLCEHYTTNAAQTDDTRAYFHGIIDIDLGAWPTAPTVSVLANHAQMQGSRVGQSTGAYSGTLDNFDPECGAALNYSTGVYHQDDDATTPIWAWYNGNVATLISVRVRTIWDSSETYSAYVQLPEGDGWPRTYSETEQATVDVLVGGVSAGATQHLYSASGSGLSDSFELPCANSPSSYSNTYTTPPKYFDYYAMRQGAISVCRARRTVCTLLRTGGAAWKIDAMYGPDGERSGYSTDTYSGTHYLSVDDSHDVIMSDLPVHYT